MNTICQHCKVAVELQDGGQWYSKEFSVLPQYCWVDPAGGSQLHAGIRVAPTPPNYERTENSKAVVSAWVIPRGADYEHAYAILKFFDSMEEAKTYENHCRTESMPLAYSIEEHDAIMRKSQEQLRAIQR